jgi:ceramide glucosyltransferase
LGEVFANPTPFLLIAWAQSDGALSILFGTAQVAKWTAELYVIRRLAERLDWKTALLLPLKDLLMLPIWVTGLFRRTVNWRGNKMLVGEGSRLIPLEQCIAPAPTLRPSHEVSGKAIAA